MIAPFHRTFWQEQEAHMLSEVRSSAPGSIRQMIANQFYLGAQHQVAMLTEYEKAIAFCPWEFYRLRAETIACQYSA